MAGVGIKSKINIPADWKQECCIAVWHNQPHFVHLCKWEKVDENIGDGFNKFLLINGKLNYGKDNIITVAVSNDYGQKQSALW